MAVNLAFWLIVIVVLVWAWFMLSPSFRNIGGTYYRIFKRANASRKSPPAMWASFTI